MPLWFAFRHQMEVSAEREILRILAQPGGERAPGDDWLNRWTLLGAALYVVLLAVVFVLLSILTGDASLLALGDGLGLDVCVLVFMGVISALSGGMIVRRQAREWIRILLYSEAHQEQSGTQSPV